MLTIKSKILYSPDPIYPGGGDCGDGTGSGGGGGGGTYSDGGGGGGGWSGGGGGGGGNHDGGGDDGGGFDDPCDGINPPSSCLPDEECLFGCGGTNNCTGPDCIDNECTGPDCSWGEDGEWRVYWMCGPNVPGMTQTKAEIIVLENGTFTTDIDKWNAQEEHYKNSSEFLQSQIQISDSFTGLTDALMPGLVYPNACYTYLGRKFGDSPSDAVQNGLTINEVEWAGFTDYDADYNLATQSLCLETCGEDDEPGGGDDEVGCMDPTSFSYNPNAVTHDQTDCCYVSGCIDTKAVNFSSGACFDDGDCCYISGCTDTAAVNINREACFDDGSCCYVKGCMNPAATNYDPLACFDDGKCIVIEASGYDYGIYCVFQPGEGDNPDYNFTFYRNLNLDQTSVIAGWGCTDVVSMMTTPQPGYQINTLSGVDKLMSPGDTITFDYNQAACKTYVGTYHSAIPAATSVGLLLPGATTPIPYLNSGPCPSDSVNQNNPHTIVGTDFSYSCGNCCDKLNDTECDSNPPGCTEPLAYNYNPSAGSSDNDTCIWKVPRYCVTSQEGDREIKNDFYFHGDSAYTQPNQPGSLANGGFLPGSTLKDNIGHLQTYFSNLSNSPNASTATSVAYFFTANSHQGDGTQSYCFVWVGWDTYVGDGSVKFNDTDGYANGPTSVMMGPYYEGNVVGGGTQGVPGINVFPAGNTGIFYSAGVGACGLCGNNSTAQPSGCIDAAAGNYDPFAVIDDGSCDNVEPVKDILGCMESSSLKFNPAATIEDGSCEWLACVCNAFTSYGYGSCPDFINNGYLIGQTDTNGMDIPLASTSAEYYSTIYPGSLIIDTGFVVGGVPFDGETVTQCNECSEYVYANTDIDKIQNATISTASTHGNAHVRNYFDSQGVGDGIILDFPYPESQSVPFPHTNELDSIGGPWSPQNLQPTISWSQAQRDRSVNSGSIDLASGTNPMIEYSRQGDGTPGAQPYGGKAFYMGSNLPVFSDDPVATTITRRGTGCDDVIITTVGTITTPQGIIGCMDPLARNYDPLATQNDSESCEIMGTGCNDPFAINYDANALFSAGTVYLGGADCSGVGFCIFEGCLDPTALNYCNSCNAEYGSTPANIAVNSGIYSGSNTYCIYESSQSSLPSTGLMATHGTPSSMSISRVSGEYTAVLSIQVPAGWNTYRNSSTGSTSPHYSILWRDNNPGAQGANGYCATYGSAGGSSFISYDAATGIEKWQLNAGGALSPAYFLPWGSGSIDIILSSPDYTTEAVTGTSYTGGLSLNSISINVPISS